jgi:hypothetical protein
MPPPQDQMRQEHSMWIMLQEVRPNCASRTAKTAIITSSITLLMPNGFSHRFVLPWNNLLQNKNQLLDSYTIDKLVNSACK